MKKNITLLSFVLVSAINTILAQFGHPELLKKVDTSNPTPYDFDENGTLDVLFGSGMMVFDIETANPRFVQTDVAEVTILGIADFSGDGFPDIAYRTTSADYTTNNINLALLDDSGEITSTIAAFSAPFVTNQYKTRDVNNDGFLDLCTDFSTPNFHASYFTLINDETGQFTPGDSATYYNMIERADIDGDGLKDILYTVFTNGVNNFDLHWKKAIGTGSTFVNQGLLLTVAPYDYSSVTAMDKNGDGKDDLIIVPRIQTIQYPYGLPVAYYYPGQPRLMINNGNNTFTDTGLITTIGRYEPPIVVDKDADGDDDLIFQVTQLSADVYSGEVIAENSSGNSFSLTTIFKSDTYPVWMGGNPIPRFFNWNSNYFSSNLIELVENQLTNTYDCHYIYNIGDNVAIHSHDGNQDGLSDIVLTNVAPTSAASTSITTFYADSTTGDLDERSTTFTGPNPGRTFTIEDVNGDDLLDYITMKPGDNQNTGLFLSQSDGSYSLSAADITKVNTYASNYNSSPSEIRPYQVTDIDEDGSKDIIFNEHFEGHWGSSLLNQNGTFVDLENYLDSNIFGATYFAIDMDNDGDKEIFTDNGLAVQVTPLNFQLITDIFKSEDAQQIFNSQVLQYPNIADLNNDGFEDFILGNYLFFNDGNNQFHNPIQVNEFIDQTWSNTFYYSSPNNVESEILDYDGDGDLDIISNLFDLIYQTSSALYVKIFESGMEYKPSERIYENLQYNGLEQTDWDHDGDMDLLLLSQTYLTNNYWQTSGWEIYLLENLNSNGYTAQGSFFLDTNSNGIMDNNENTIGSGSISSGDALSGWVLDDGTFQLSFDSIGEYNIQAGIDPYFYNFTTPSAASINMTTLNPNVTDIHFGLSATGNLPVAQEDLYGEPGIIFPVEDGRIYLADMDGSGDKDYYTESGALYLYPANVEEAIIVETGWNNIPCEVSDFNGDGTIDFIAILDDQLYFVSNINNSTFSGTLLGDACGSIFTEDLDEDNDMDLIVTNCSSNNSIYINDGMGNFSATTNSSFSNFVSYLDFDQDGLKDILADDGTASSWSKNLGNLSFSVPTSITGLIFNQYTTTQLFDFDGDGDLDLFQLPASNSKICRYLRNDDNNSFEQSEPIDYDESSDSTDYIYSSSSGFIDMNGDDLQDIYQQGWSFNQWTSYVYINNGNQTFAASVTNTAANIFYPSYINKLYDYNDDGVKDMVSYGLDYNGITGTATSVVLIEDLEFKLPKCIHTSMLPENMMIQKSADGINNEILLSIGSYDYPSLEVVQNRGDNNASAPVNLYNIEYDAYGYSYYYNRNFLPLHYNNDGMIDFLCPNSSIHSGDVLLSDSSNHTYTFAPALFFSDYTQVYAEDLNKDGYDEVIMYSDNNYVTDIYWNFEGTLSWVAGFNDYYRGVTDINNDGLLDLSMDWASQIQVSEGVFIPYEGSWESYTPFRSMGTFYNGTALYANNKFVDCDFNNDQIPDNYSGVTKAYNISNADGTSESFVFESTGFSYSTSFDINGDLFQDIIYAKGTGIYQMLNTGNGQFDQPTQILSGFVVKSLDHLDWDNDGDEDLMYCADYLFGTGQDGVYWMETLISANKRISGIVFYDENENGIWETNEQKLNGWSMSITSPSLTDITHGEGGYSFLMANSGTYEVNLALQNNWTNTTPIQESIFLDDTNPAQLDVQFGVVPSLLEMALETSVQGSLVVCNRPSNLWLNINNIGTVNADYKVSFILPEPVTFDYSTPAPDSIAGDTLYWEFDSLAIADNQLIMIHAINPGFQFMGATFVYKMITTTLEDEPNVYEVNYTVPTFLCAYDPNDKTEFTGVTSQGYVSGDEPLEYLIRFQNTGNYYAFDVRVEDQLSANVDKSSLHVIATSHDMETSIDENGKVTFLFQNIMLPDSTMDEPGSHGFIRYTVKPLETVTHGTIIPNTAEIYFDYNPAIVTNTTTNTIFDCVNFNATINTTSEASCFEQHVSAEVSSEWFETIEWTLNDNPVGNAATVDLGTIEADAILDVTIDNALCEPTSTEVFIEHINYEMPSISVSDSTFCEGEYIVLTSSYADNNYWYNNGNPVGSGQSITVAQGGNYSLNIEEENCTTTAASIEITMFTMPAIGAIETDNMTLSVLTIADATYQWYFNGNPIDGATNPTYEATLTGNYSVVATNSNDCGTTSAEVYIEVISVNEFATGNVMIYPNPVQDQLSIKINLPNIESIQIIDAQGRIVFAKNQPNVSLYQIDTTQFAEGAYTLLILHDGELANMKFVKTSQK